MTCRELTVREIGAGADYRAAPGYRFAGRAAGLWRAYMDRRARRATVRILQSLDRRTLKDIGIDPSEIHSVVYGPSDRHRRHY